MDWVGGWDPVYNGCYQRLYNILLQLPDDMLTTIQYLEVYVDLVKGVGDGEIYSQVWQLQVQPNHTSENKRKILLTEWMAKEHHLITI